MSSSTAVLQLDDNLSNGQTYTFQYACGNWFCFTDLSSTIAGDIVANAPDFLTSLGVTSPSATDLYNVQFTYEGDGSDVVSDVANSIIAAVLAGSNDTITFIGAVAANAAAITVSPSQAVTIVGQATVSTANSVVAGATSVVSNAATGVTSAAGSVVNTALVGLLPTLIVIVLIILFVLPSLTKSAGSLKGSGVL